ncbi:hypothetical protein ACHAXS_000877 [Conticribra weissflogii]
MEYVQRAKLRLDQECNCVAKQSLPEHTCTLLLRIVKTELIKQHAKTLVDMEGSGFAAILKVVAWSPVGAAGAHRGIVAIDWDHLVDLANVYNLFLWVPSSVDHLREALSERIRLDGRALVWDQETNSAPPSAFVKGVLAMRERFHAVISEAMRGEKKDFLNADSWAANCLAIYVDKLPRVSLKGLDNGRWRWSWIGSSSFLEALGEQEWKRGSREGHDVLAQSGVQISIHVQAGGNVQRHEDLHGDRQGILCPQKKEANAPSPPLIDLRDAKNGGKPINVKVSLLTTGYWPSQNVAPCSLPPPVKAAMDRFQKYTGRKLSWQTSTGSAEIQATLPPCDDTISGSPPIKCASLSSSTITTFSPLRKYKTKPTSPKL